MSDNLPILASLESIRALRMSKFNPLRSLTPARLAAALEQFDIGYLREAALIFETIADRDDTLKSVKPKREKEVSQLDRQVLALPGTGDAGQAHREVLEDFWGNVRTVNAYDRNERGGFRRLVKQMMSAVSYRYAVHHIVWRPQNGQLRATLEFVPLWLFENTTGTLRYLRSPYAQTGEMLADGEWLVTQGDGLMIACAIGWSAKRNAFNDWLVFSEKFSVPGVLGRTSAKKGSPEGDAMRDAVESFGHDWAGVLYGDDGAHTQPLEIIQANGSPAGMPMPAVVERVDRKFAALYRGADLSTMSAGSGDGSGASLQGKEKDILLADDAETITETLEEISRMVIAWHFGRGTEPLARLSLVVPTDDDEKFYLTSVQAMHALGVRLDKGAVLERLGLQEADPAEPALGEGAANTEDHENAYNPLQPRAGKGEHGGGQWTKGGVASKGESAARGEMREASAEDRKRLGVAPAFTDVMVTDDESADLLATAKNAKGKTVYYYSRAYSESQKGMKFARIAALNKEMPTLQAQIDRDVISGGQYQEQALALRMISLTGLRNGGDDGGGKVPAFGASNLRCDQCRVEGDKVHLNFVGKKGVAQRHTFEDARLARHIYAKKASGAVQVFEGSSKKTLDYLGKISGNKFKVHDFRTWHGTMLADATAEKIIARGEAPTDAKSYKKFQMRVANVVGRQLGNDGAMSLKAYIHPAVFTPYEPRHTASKAKKKAS